MTSMTAENTGPLSRSRSVIGCWIDNVSIVNFCESRHVVFIGAVRTEDIYDTVASSDKPISDDPSVASPVHCLGTHDHWRVLLSKLD